MILRVENLDVFYGDVQALNSVSLEIEEGAIVAIVGANGAGKSDSDPLARRNAAASARGRYVSRHRDFALAEPSGLRSRIRPGSGGSAGVSDAVGG